MSDRFPLLQHMINGKRLAYLDNAATTQKPRQVLDAMQWYYETWNANPHRGVYALSAESTRLLEESRKAVATFINAGSPEEIVFTRNATESLNLLAKSFGPTVLGPGDEVVIPISEHHSNLVPWQLVCKETGASLVYLYLDENGNISLAEVERKITDRTKIVSFALVGNVLGLELPAAAIIAKARQVGATVIADCAQSIAHMPLDVSALDVDFAVFSSHKMFGPTGVGLLYGKADMLKRVPPFLSGGDMIEYVQEQRTTFAPIPQRFEAGTQDVAGIVGFQSAIRFIEEMGYRSLMEIEEKLGTYALSRLSALQWIKIYGIADKGQPRFPIITFTVEGIHPHDVASILDAEGVAIRAGHHCAQPLMGYLQVNATCRVSLSVYNTTEDIDQLINALKKARRLFGYGD